MEPPSTPGMGRPTLLLQVCTQRSWGSQHHWQLLWMRTRTACRMVSLKSSRSMTCSFGTPLGTWRPIKSKRNLRENDGMQFRTLAEPSRHENRVPEAEMDIKSLSQAQSQTDPIRSSNNKLPAELDPDQIHPLREGPAPRATASELQSQYGQRAFWITRAFRTWRYGRQRVLRRCLLTRERAKAEG